MARNRRRTDEAQGIDTGVLQQSVDRFLVTLNDVEHARRKAGAPDEIGTKQRRRRISLRGLENERIAAGQRHRKHPHGDHRRKIERRDAGDDPERLPYRVTVDARTDVLGNLAFQQLRRPAGKLHDLEPAGDFAARIGEHLAVLGADDRRQLVGVRLDQITQLVHEARPTQWTRCRPSGERGTGRGNGSVDLRGTRERHRRRLGTGRRIEHGRGTPTLGFDDRAADVMLERLQIFIFVLF